LLKGSAMTKTEGNTSKFHAETAAIVVAYVSRNAISPAALVGLIPSVHTALESLTAPVKEPQPRRLAPAAKPAPKAKRGR